MKSVHLKIIDTNIKTKIPEYATMGSSGMDLYSTNFEDYVLEPGEIKLFPLNFSVEIKPNDDIEYEIQIRSKSGLALHNGVIVLNAPGTCDFDYRGEVGVILCNVSKKPFIVKPQSKIAQMVLQKIEKIKFIEVDRLIETARGSGGFGSTGLE